MTARPEAPAATSPAFATAERVPLITVLRGLLLLEAAGTLVLAIALSMVAGAVGGGDETSLRFAAAAAFLFAIFAAVAARGARRRRGWAWTMSAILQVLLAIGTGIAVMTAEWHPALLAIFGLATVVMLVLSTSSVRRALGQD